MPSNKVYVYIDETGDRGSSQSSSPIFGMAAIVIADHEAGLLRTAVDQLRADLNVPPGVVMSWKAHMKTHDRRRRAVDVLTELECVQVCYVYAVKDSLSKDSYRTDPERFYNYVAYKTFKSAVWAARNLHGANASIHVRFGHVKGHDHTTTEQYIRTEAKNDTKVPDAMIKSLRWVSADRYRESQAADAFGGFLSAAIWPQGKFGYVEPSYLLNAWARIRNSHECAVPLGIMSMPHNEAITSAEWFPCDNCARRS